MLKTAYCHCEDIWGPGFSVTGQNAKVKRYPNLAMLSCPDPVDTVYFISVYTNVLSLCRNFKNN